MDWNNLIVGALGGVVGSLVTVWGSIVLRSADLENSKVHAAAVLSIALDRFVEQCTEVVADDGYPIDEPEDHRAKRVAQVDAPRLDLDKVSVEWKVLPIGLMVSVLKLPARLAATATILQIASKFSDPPYDDYFEQRQLKYGELGLLAADLARQLRALVKLPPPAQDEWDAAGWLNDEHQKLVRRIAARESAFP